MKTQLFISSAAAVLGALFVPMSAQAAGQEPLPQSVQTVPGNSNQAKVTSSDQSRSAVKAETRQATRQGKLTPGQAPLPQDTPVARGEPDKAVAPDHQKSRSEVKAATREAEARGTLRPAGEDVKPLDAPRVK